MKKTEIGNGWYEVIDTRKGDDAKPFYVNKAQRKVITLSLSVSPRVRYVGR